MIRGMTLLPSFMDLALKRRKPPENPRSPRSVNAWIVRDYEVIAQAGNRTLTRPRSDPAPCPKFASGKPPRPSATERLSICDPSTSRWSPARCAPSRDLVCVRIRACITARGRSQGRRGVKNPVCGLRLADLPHVAGGLFRGRRKLGGDASADFLRRGVIFTSPILGRVARSAG